MGILKLAAARTLLSGLDLLPSKHRTGIHAEHPTDPGRKVDDGRQIALSSASLSQNGRSDPLPYKGAVQTKPESRVTSASLVGTSSGRGTEKSRALATSRSRDRLAEE